MIQDYKIDEILCELSGNCTNTIDDDTPPVCGNNNTGVERQARPSGSIANYPDTRALCKSGIPTDMDTEGTDGHFNWNCSNDIGDFVECTHRKYNSTRTGKPTCGSTLSKPIEGMECGFPSFLSGDVIYNENIYNNYLGYKRSNWTWTCEQPNQATKKTLSCSTKYILIREITINNNTDTNHGNNYNNSEYIEKSGCSTVTNYFAREPLSRIMLEKNGFNYNAFKNTFSTNATILTVCNEDSLLNGNGGNFKYEEIQDACSDGYHPMEKWELDMLQGEGRWVYGEDLVKQSTIRFNEVNNKTLTHWLFDNYFEEESSYGYMQGSDNSVSVNRDGFLKIRCVQNNSASRNGHTKQEQGGCGKTVRTTDGLEYCSESSNLIKDYFKTARMATKKGIPHLNSKASVIDMKAGIAFEGKNICPSGFDYPEYPEYYLDNPDMRKGFIKTISKKTGNIYFIAFLKEGRVVFVGDSINKLDSKYILIKSPDYFKTYRVLKDYFGSNNNDDLYFLNNLLIENNNSYIFNKSYDSQGEYIYQKISGVCIKK